MKTKILKPSIRDLQNWLAIPPIRGDLLFLKKSLPTSLGKTTHWSRAQILHKKEKIWSLSLRTWYGYSLNKANYCVITNRGELEKLDKNTLEALALEQVKLGVPTLIKERKLSTRLRSKLLKAGKYRWITSKAWKELNKSEKITALNAWMRENQVPTYKSTSDSNLPVASKSNLKRIRKIFGDYSALSGPNCFAAVAAIISNRKKVGQSWLKWETLEKLLITSDYEISNRTKPQAGDVIIISDKNIKLHAVYALDTDFYFEKTSQNFYSPYRVQTLKNLKREWRNCQLEIWSNRFQNEP